MDIEIWKEVNKRIQNPNKACQYIGELMENCKDKTFNDLITSNFSNPPSQIQNSISVFSSICKEKFKLKTIYLEMNGFDVNPNRWFFDFFGYNTVSEDETYLDWLSDWQSPDFPDVTLTGLEAIQKLYKQNREENIGLSLEKQNNDLNYNQKLATFMVMAKFCKLIDESLENKKLNFHVYATAHDFDIIYHKRA